MEKKNSGVGVFKPTASKKLAADKESLPED